MSKKKTNKKTQQKPEEDLEYLDEQHEGLMKRSKEREKKASENLDYMSFQRETPLVFGEAEHIADSFSHRIDYIKIYVHKRDAFPMQKTLLIAEVELKNTNTANVRSIVNSIKQTAGRY